MRFSIFEITKKHLAPHMKGCILKINTYNTKVNINVAQHIIFVKIKEISVFNISLGYHWHQ